MTTESKITSPPILDETGKKIVQALLQLKNTDASLRVRGKPADSASVGDKFDALLRSIGTNFTILQNIFSGALDNPFEVNEFIELRDPKRVYIYRGANDSNNKLQQDHWYYYFENRWVDGGPYNTEVSLKLNLLRENLTELGNTVTENFTALTNLINEKVGFTQFLVGWQEYLMPYYDDVISYGYGSASWGDAYMADSTHHSIHTQICGNESLGIVGVDLSGFDDFILMGSYNGLRTTDVGDWDATSLNTDTYFGALRDTINYIFSANSSARVWVWNISLGMAPSTVASYAEAINAELPTMCMKLGLNLVNFSNIGFNQWTKITTSGGTDGWTFDGTHYNQTGNFMVGQYIRHIMIGS